MSDTVVIILYKYKSKTSKESINVKINLLGHKYGKLVSLSWVIRERAKCNIYWWCFFLFLLLGTGENFITIYDFSLFQYLWNILGCNFSDVNSWKSTWEQLGYFVKDIFELREKTLPAPSSWLLFRHRNHLTSCPLPSPNVLMASNSHCFFSAQQWHCCWPYRYTLPSWPCCKILGPRGEK